MIQFFESSNPLIERVTTLESDRNMKFVKGKDSSRSRSRGLKNSGRSNGSKGRKKINKRGILTKENTPDQLSSNLNLYDIDEEANRISSKLRSQNELLRRKEKKKQTYL